MARLLADAQKITGVKYDMNNLSDVYNAIHVIQGELDITGTTAKESASTFSGSMASMKASFNNFMAALTTGKGVNTALTNLLDTAMTFVMKNLIPMCGNIIKSLPSVLISLIKDIIPKILTNVTKTLNDKLSSVSKDSAGKWASSFGQKLLDGVVKLIPKVLELMKVLITKLPPIAIEIAKGFVAGLVDKVLSGIRTLVDKIKSAFKFNVSLPHIKLPHFSITPEGWKLGDLLKGVKPSLGINWYANGGIIDKASLIGVGEKGPEAVIPLNGPKAKPFAKAIADEIGGGGTTYNFGDITLNASDVDGVRTLEEIVEIFRRAKAYA